jgi:hypothetical protein
MRSQSSETQNHQAGIPFGADVAVVRTPKGDVQPGSHRIEAIRDEITAATATLRRHRYFELCRTRQIGRAKLLEIIQQMYCLSIYFERLLTFRISHHSSDMDLRVLRLARLHLQEEFGHAELFRECLVDNGIPIDDVSRIRPTLFTRALYGYLLATISHENEFVTNAAMTQAMENLAVLVFSATLPVAEHHKIISGVLAHHSLHDEQHALLGIELAGDFDDSTLRGAVAAIRELHSLMGFVLDEWLGAA